MRRIKLTKEEKEIERALLAGEYVSASKKEVDEIAKAIAARKKDAVLHIRINRADLAELKKKARRLGVKYQTFIAEFLRRLAHG